MITNRTTRVAFQAAMAVTITETLAYFFQLERSYWSTLTALFLISQTWGESVKKAAERVIMTIIGGIVGTLLYALLPHQTWLVFTCLLVAVFCAVFFIEISYLIATFFITLFVVFLFALIAQWNLQLLQDRIIETAIGAVIACTVAVCVFPVQAVDVTEVEFELFFKRLIQFINKALSLSLTQKQVKQLQLQKNELARQHNKMREQTQASYYELVFSNISKIKFDFILEHFALLNHYTTSLYETRLDLDLNPNYIDEIEKLEQIINHNLKVVDITCFKSNEKNQKKLVLDDKFDEIKSQLLTKYKQDLIAGNKINTHVFTNYSFLYYMEKINQNLISLHQRLT